MFCWGGAATAAEDAAPAGAVGEFYAAARLHPIRPLRGHLQLCTPPVCTPRALASRRALGCPQGEG